jgi:hypothetical protein
MTNREEFLEPAVYALRTLLHYYQIDPTKVTVMLRAKDQETRARLEMAFAVEKSKVNVMQSKDSLAFNHASCVTIGGLTILVGDLDRSVHA